MSENTQEVEEVKSIGDYTQEVEEVKSIGDYTLTVTLAGKEYTAYLKEPDRGVISRVLNIIRPFDGSQPDYIKGGEIILRECFIGGDNDILIKDKLILAGALEAISLIEIPDAVIKKN